MGLWTIDNVTMKERERREMRRHDRRMWAITLIEIAALGGVVTGLIYFARWLGI